MTELGVSIGRAEEQTEHLRACAMALEDLSAYNVLADPGDGDPLAQDLHRIGSDREVEDELAALRRAFRQRDPRREFSGWA